MFWSFSNLQFILHRSYYSLRVETSYIQTCFLALFIFITKCGNLVHTYVFSSIVHIHHSVWKPRTYIRVFWHYSYSSLSVETSYIHTCFLALFICITKCGKPVYPYVFSGIVRIHHSVRKICVCYNILFYGNRYSFLL